MSPISAAGRVNSGFAEVVSEARYRSNWHATCSSILSESLASSHPGDYVARILIIDDDAHIRQPVRLGLEKDGHTVDEAIDGVEGAARCRETPPDLVICDILMPEKDGFETMRDLRREYPDMLIMILSGSMGAYLEMASDLGADFVLSKPFKLSDLQFAVSTLVGKPDLS